MTAFSIKDTIINQCKKTQYHLELNKLEKIELIIAPMVLKNIERQRDSVFDLINDKNEYWPSGLKTKSSHKATIIKSGKKCFCKIKIAGHFKDHLKPPVSLKVNCDNKDLLSKTKNYRFNILNPLTRHLYVDFLVNAILEKKGLTTLETGPVNVEINGKNEVYLFEENFKSTRLNNNLGFVFKNVSANNSINLTPIRKNKANKKILKTINKSNLLDHIEIEKTLDYLALSDIFNSSHQLFAENQRFYYSQLSNKFYPIAREFWLERASLNQDLVLESIKNNENLKSKIDHIFIALANDSVFFSQYKKSLKHYADTKFIENILEEISQKLTQMEVLYWKNFAWYIKEKPKEEQLKTILSNKKNLRRIL